MNKNYSIQKMTVCAILIAISIVIPMFMPKIIIGPFSATLAAHVPVILATFISPLAAIAVAIGGAIGFFLTTPFVIAVRAMTHIFFAGFMALAFIKFNKNNVKNVAIIGLLGGLIHAFCEVVAIFVVLGVSTDRNTIFFIITFIGFIAHHIVDLIFAYIVYRALAKVNLWNFDKPRKAVERM